MNQNEFFFKIVIVGAPSVGKTALLERYVEGKFSEGYKATIGADFRTKHMVVKDQQVLMQIWDTAGQERFRALAAPFYRGANVCVLVFDLSNNLSFEALQQWRDEFMHHADLDDAKNFPFVLVGNKSDLNTNKVPREKVERWIRDNQYKMEYYETSAKDGTHVEQMFQKVGDLCLQSVPPSDLYVMKGVGNKDNDDEESERGSEAIEAHGGGGDGGAIAAPNARNARNQDALSNVSLDDINQQNDDASAGGGCAC